jgi:hypothetical protein
MLLLLRPVPLQKQNMPCPKGRRREPYGRFGMFTAQRRSLLASMSLTVEYVKCGLASEIVAQWLKPLEFSVLGHFPA